VAEIWNLCCEVSFEISANVFISQGVHTVADTQRHQILYLGYAKVIRSIIFIFIADLASFKHSD
jgi:hypothetical protein